MAQVKLQRVVVYALTECDWPRLHNLLQAWYPNSNNFGESVTDEVPHVGPWLKI